MKYYKCRLSFSGGVHIGGGSLDEGKNTFMADTLFSALYLEAMGLGLEKRFFERVSSGRIIFTDAFPYIDDICYLPKPMIQVDKRNASGDSIIKKAMKGLSYIPMERMKDYLHGNLNAGQERKLMEGLGKGELRTSAAIHGLDETLPYHVGVYHFNDGNGLFFILAADTDEDKNLFLEILENLGYSGIGGKRSSGFGRFGIKDVEAMNEALFEGESGIYMALSVCLPDEGELETAISGASFQMVKRGGFVYSADYSDEPLKKRELYMISSGSCFTHRFNGYIADVSNRGHHPVYRYGKPVFYSLKTDD